MEGDDSEGADKPSVEFVTDPFPVSAPGIGQLNQAFAEIEGIMGRLGQFSAANRDGSLQNTKSKRFVKGYQHGLGQTLWFSQGRPQARFKLQATHGVSLEEIPVVMQYLGMNVPGETLAQSGDRAGARQLMYPGANPAFRNAEIANLIGASPSLADQAIARLQASPHLNAWRQASFGAHTAALRGFLSQVILYVKALSAPETGPTQAKYLVPLLGRTSFATIFNLIPDDGHKRRLQRAHAAALVDAIVEGANHQAFIHDHNGHAIDTGFAAGLPLIRDLKPTGYILPILTSLSLQNWVEGFTTGTDYLSPSTMEAWLNANTALTPQESKKQSSYLESFSVLGKNQGVQSTHTDPTDIAGHTALSIYENRLIHGKTYFTAQEAHDAAFKYLQFFLDLKNAGGAGGTYPAAAAPNAPVAAGGGKLKYVDPTSVLGYFRL
jgi:hypothetical protein